MVTVWVGLRSRGINPIHNCFFIFFPRRFVSQFRIIYITSPHRQGEISLFHGMARECFYISILVSPRWSLGKAPLQIVGRCATLVSSPNYRGLYYYSSWLHLQVVKGRLKSSPRLARVGGFLFSAGPPLVGGDCLFY